MDLDLSALPNGNGSTTNLLAVLRSEHSLDILVQANTAIDYLQLTIESCQCGPDIVA